MALIILPLPSDPRILPITLSPLVVAPPYAGGLGGRRHSLLGRGPPPLQPLPEPRTAVPRDLPPGVGEGLESCSLQGPRAGDPPPPLNTPRGIGKGSSSWCWSGSYACFWGSCPPILKERIAILGRVSGILVVVFSLQVFGIFGVL